VPPHQYLWVIGFALVIILALEFLGPVLTPFLVGAIMAYIGAPIVDRLQKRGMSRTTGTLIVTLMFGLAIVAVLLVLIPLVRAEFLLAAKKLPDLFAQLAGRMAPWLYENFGVVIALDPGSIKEFVTENLDELKDYTPRIAAGLKAGGLFLLSLIVNLVLIPVVMFYLLRDWNMLWKRFFMIVPRRWRWKTREIAVEIDRVLGEFLRGQGLVMASLAIYYIVGLSLAGLQFAIPIGILIGLWSSSRTSASAPASCWGCSRRCCNGTGCRGS
jgi:predicted PurR-regulated permease PerM